MRFFRRFKALFGLLLLSSLFTAAGGHWFALQGFAWAKMAITTYDAKKNVKAALQETFDGEHPCRICHEIVEHRKSERPTPTTEEFRIKLDPFFPESADAPVPPAFQAVDFFATEVSLFSRSVVPPTPPPKPARLSV